MKSHIIMPAVTETFMLCLVPNCGISRHPSAMSTMCCCTPFTSFPMMMAYFFLGSGVKF